MSSSIRRAALSVSLVALAVGSAETPAMAGPLVSSADCRDQALSQPFLPWADPASYTPQPGGDFDTLRSGWAFVGDAGIVAGNEPYEVSGGGRRSLAMHAGSQVTTSSICVGVSHPSMRFFVRRTNGSAESTLGVEVLFEDAVGAVQALPIGFVSATSDWMPSLPLPVVANLLPLLPDARTAIAFRFAPVGDASWQIDDIYVDPWYSR